jgi:hypothetical protein
MYVDCRYVGRRRHIYTLVHSNTLADVIRVHIDITYVYLCNNILYGLAHMRRIFVDRLVLKNTLHKMTKMFCQLMTNVSEWSFSYKVNVLINDFK